MKRMIGVCVISLALSACSDSEFGRTPGASTASEQKIASFRQTLSRKPNNVKALNGIGDEHARVASWELAAGSYKEALIVDSRNRDALLGYSAAQSALGRYNSALEHANRAMGRKNDIPALIAASVALNGQQRHSEAVRLLRQALDADPRDLDVRNNLALSMALMGDQTAFDIQRSVAFAPDADYRHRRNFYLVAAILGRESNAAYSGSSLKISQNEIKKINAIGRRARSSGVSAFGLASRT